MRISALLLATGCLLAAVKASSSDEELGSPLPDQGDQVAHCGIEDFGEDAMEMLGKLVHGFFKGLGRLSPFGRKDSEQAIEEKSSSTRMAKYMVVLGVMVAIAAAGGVAMYGASPEIISSPFTERTCEEVLAVLENSCHFSPGTLFQLLQYGSPFPTADLPWIDWTWQCNIFKDLGFFDSFEFSIFHLSKEWAECLKSSPEYAQLAANFDQRSMLQFNMPWTEAMELFTQKLYEGITNGTALLSPDRLPWEVDTLFTNLLRTFSQIAQECRP